MRKLAITLALLGATGCATVKVEAPQPVKLASITENARPYRSKKVWYLFWGLVPISNNSTADLMPTESGKEVRVKVEAQYGIIDYLVSLVTLGILSSQTVTTYVAY